MESDPRSETANSGAEEHASGTIMNDKLEQPSQEMIQNKATSLFDRANDKRSNGGAS